MGILEYRNIDAKEDAKARERFQRDRLRRERIRASDQPKERGSTPERRVANKGGDRARIPDAENKARADARGTAAENQAKLRGEKTAQSQAQEEKLRQSQQNRSANQAGQNRGGANPSGGQEGPQKPGRTQRVVQGTKDFSNKVGGAAKQVPGKFPRTANAFGRFFSLGKNLVKGSLQLADPGSLRPFSLATSVGVGVPLADKLLLEDPGERLQDQDTAQAQTLSEFAGRLAPTEQQIANRDPSLLRGVQRGAANANFLDTAKRAVNFLTPGDFFGTGDESKGEAARLKDLQDSQTEIFQAVRDASGSLEIASRTSNAFANFQEALLDPEIGGRITNPNLSDRQRRAAQQDLAATLTEGDVDRDVIVEVLTELGADSDFLRLVSGQARPVTIDQESGTFVEGEQLGAISPTGDNDDFIQGREGPLDGSNLGTEIFQIGEGLDFGDSSVAEGFDDSRLIGTVGNEGGDVVQQNEVLRSDATAEQEKADERARQQFINSKRGFFNDPEFARGSFEQADQVDADIDELLRSTAERNKGRSDAPGQRDVILSGVDESRAFANRLRDPNQASQLLAEARIKSGSIPGASAAQLSQLSTEDRVAAIADIKRQGRTEVERRLRTPGSRRRLDRIADPDGTLRKAAERGFRGAREALANARSDARASQRSSLEGELIPDFGLLEGLDVDELAAGRERTQFERGRQARTDFETQIGNLAGNNESLQRTILSDALSAGIIDQVSTGQITRQQAQTQAVDLFVVNAINRNFSAGTGVPTGTAANQTLNQLFGPNGRFTLRNAQGTDLFRNKNRGALGENILSAITGGFFGSTGIETVIIKDTQSGESKTLKDLLKDPIIAEALQNKARQAQTQ